MIRPALLHSTVQRTQDDAAAELVDIIQQHIDPDSWRDAGGTVGSIHSTGHKLVITTTPARHERIAELLQRLESSEPL